VNTSYAAKALRKALMESGAKQVAFLRIPQVGPTLNLLKGNRCVKKELRLRQSQYAALLQSLPSAPSDPETMMDSEPQQNTISMPFDTAACLQMIPESILKSSQSQNLSRIFQKKRQSSKSTNSHKANESR